MLAIDHIVIVAKDPAKAAEAFGKKHGLMTLEGGRHTKWGTYNHLAYFSNDCYIEWLGIFDQSLAAQSDNPLVQQLVKAIDGHFEGPIQFALRTNEMDMYLERFLETDIAYTGPIPGSRQKPDGAMLEWRMLFPYMDVGIAPFFIEWGAEKNVPQGVHLINNQQLKSIDCGLARDLAKEIYRMDVTGDVIQLENGLLNLREGDGVAFEVES